MIRFQPYGPLIRFQPYGPFKVFTRDRAVDSQREVEFWNLVTDKEPGLSGAVGCYIFGIRAGKGIRPWYVGKTERSFKAEVFQPHKFVVYFEAMRQQGKGTALLYFIAKTTPSGRFAKPSANKLNSVLALERLLIGTCLLRNSSLINSKTTKYLKQLQVPGYMNEPKGARPKDARALACLLGIAKARIATGPAIEEEPETSFDRAIAANEPN